MRELTLAESQQAQLSILKKVCSFCDENDITYWIMYGTLLGAVRHKGFIPWDDDIDIAMPREDYERFISLFTNGNVDGLSIDSALVNSKVPFYITRVCDTNFFLKYENSYYTSGLFIDVYPFDGKGDSIEIWEEKDKYHRFLKKCIQATQIKGLLLGNTVLHKILNVPIVIYAKMKGNRYFFELIDKESKQFTWEESKLVGPVVWSNEKYNLKKEWFEESVELAFEDISVRVPARYEDLLSELYGNYLELPPENKRQSSHDYKAYRREE